MKRVMLLVVAACAGGQAPTKPANPQPPGVIWETAAEPWHVLRPAFTAMLDGELITIGGHHGWIQQVDVATGKPVRERKLEMGIVTSLVALGDGRILALGFSGDALDTPPAAFLLDAQLVPRRVELPVRTVAKGGLVFPRAIRLGDGIAIAGAGLPLAIYEPKDLTVRATLDNAIGWRQLGGSGEILLAERGGLVKRFDLGTNGQRDLGYGVPSHLVAAEGVTLTRIPQAGKWVVELRRDDKTQLVLPDENSSLHAYDAKRFVTTQQHELRIHELPSGEIKKRITIDDPNISLVNLSITGRRAVTVSNGIVRVIDLETGAVTPKQTTSRQAIWLAVGDDGTVLAGNPPQVWTMAGGKRGLVEELGEVAIEAVRPDDPRHYAVSRTVEQRTTVALHTVGSKPTTVPFPGGVDSTYLTREGVPLFVVDGDSSKRVMKLEGTTPIQLFELSVDADVLAGDADSDLLLASEGRIATVTREGKLVSTLRAPHCEGSYRYAAIDPASNRAVTYDRKDLALWDRKAGTLLATIQTGALEDVLFVPKRDELVLTYAERVVLWSPARGTRTLRWPGVIEPAASPDGKRLALAFADGRIGVYDLAVLLAAPLGPDLPKGDALPETCEGDDPLVVAKPAGDDGDDGDDNDPPPPEEDD